MSDGCMMRAAMNVVFRLHADSAHNGDDTGDGVAKLDNDGHILGNLLRHCGQDGSTCLVVACGVLGHHCNRAYKHHHAEHLYALVSEEAFLSVNDFLNHRTGEFELVVLKMLISLVKLLDSISEESREHRGSTNQKQTGSDDHHNLFLHTVLTRVHLDDKHEEIIQKLLKDCEVYRINQEPAEMSTLFKELSTAQGLCLSHIRLISLLLNGYLAIFNPSIPIRRG